MPKQFYSGDNIRKRKCLYNVIFGERSNGKTFDVIRHAFKEYIDSGERNQLGVIRRWAEDFVGAKSAKTMYDSMIYDGNGNNQIREISGGKYDGVEYYAGRYYLTQWDDEKEKTIMTDKIIAIAFPLTSAEHMKSGSFPLIRTILFDEFIGKTYLPDEFVVFQNVLSTIIRQRDDVTIYMCGNTVNKYCPYFNEMGLYNVKKMKQGTIDVYTFGESGKTTVAVEYSDSPSKGKASDKYFAFDNPKLQMIQNGAWEIAVYPHIPYKYLPREIVFTYFIVFDGDILQCEVIEHDATVITYVHAKTTELRHPDEDVIFCTDYDPRPNWIRNILKPSSRMAKRVAWFYSNGRVFYQDNETGDIVRNYLEWCRKN